MLYSTRSLWGSLLVASVVMVPLMGSIVRADSIPNRPEINPVIDNPAMDPAQNLVAQASGSSSTGSIATCYWSTLQMGVYQEPNPLSQAVGVLPAGAIVLIGPGSGQGWVRLQSPVVGWMVTTGLQNNPLKGCNGLGTIVPVGAATPPVPTPTTPVPLTPTGSSLQIGIPVLCTVTPKDGLPVRNQPILHPRTLTAILEPGLHRLQFSDRQVRLKSGNEVRDWFYITLPVKGWISPRIVGNPTVDLVGEGCLSSL